MTFIHTSPLENANQIVPAATQATELNGGTPEAPIWVPIPGAYIDNIFFRTNGVDTAQFTRRYGRVKYPDGAELDWKIWLRGSSQVTDRFVRSTFTGNNGEVVRFYGYCIGEDNRKDGDPVPAPGGEPAGDQIFHCMGMSYFLDRVQINGHYTYNQADTGELQYNPHPLTFNNRSSSGNFDLSYNVMGNKDASTVHPITTPDGVVEVPLFPSSSFILVSRWSAWDIMLHLVYLYLPKTPSVNFGMPIKWRMDPAAEPFLKDIYPVVETDNRTFLKVINDVINPRRGLVWWSTYDESTNTSTIHVNSTSPQDIDMPAATNPQGENYPSGKLPKNSVPIELDYEEDWNVAQSIDRSNFSRTYSQIIVRGARRTTTATYSLRAKTLEEGWDPQVESDYIFNPTGDTNDWRPDKIRKARKQDKFARVFTHFLVDQFFDGKTNQGDGSPLDSQAFPILASYLEPGPPDVIPDAYGYKAFDPPDDPRVRFFNQATTRFLPQIPFKAGIEYNNSKEDPLPGTGAWVVEPNIIDNSSANDNVFMPILAVVPTAELKGPPYTKFWTRLEELGTPQKEIPEDRQLIAFQMRVPGHSVHPLSDGAGFQIKSADGEQAHLTHGRFSITSAVKKFKGVPRTSRINFADIRITAACEMDDYCQVIQYPANGNRQGDLLIIDAGRGYRLDYLAPDTITHIDGEGELAINAEGGVLRDDRPALDRIALAAKAWYDSSFHELSLQFRNIRSFTRYIDDNGIPQSQQGIYLGQMITEIASNRSSLLKTNVNTVVTGISYQGRQMTTTINTSYYDFPSGLLP